MYIYINFQQNRVSRSVKTVLQWRSEDNWRPGAKLNFAPPPLQKNLKNDIEMFIVFN